MRNDNPSRPEKPPKPVLPPKPPRITKRQKSKIENEPANKTSIALSSERGFKQDEKKISSPPNRPPLPLDSTSKASLSNGLYEIPTNSHKPATLEGHNNLKMIDDETSVRGSQQSLASPRDPKVDVLDFNNGSSNAINQVPSIEITDESVPKVETNVNTNECPSEQPNTATATSEPRQEVVSSAPPPTRPSPCSAIKSNVIVEKYRDGRPYYRKTCPVAEAEGSESSEYDDFCCMPTAKLSVIIKNVLSDTPHQPAIASRSFSSPAQAIYGNKSKLGFPDGANKPKPKPPPRPKPPDLSKRLKRDNSNMPQRKNPDDDGTEDSGDYKDILFRKKEAVCKSPYEELNFVTSSGYSQENLNEEGDYHSYEEVGVQSPPLPSQPGNERQYEKINVCSPEDVAPTGNISEIDSVYDEQGESKSTSMAFISPSPQEVMTDVVSVEGESGDTTDTLSVKESLQSEYMTPTLSVSSSMQNPPLTSDASEFNNLNDVLDIASVPSIDVDSMPPTNTLSEVQTLNNTEQKPSPALCHKEVSGPKPFNEEPAVVETIVPEVLAEVSSSDMEHQRGIDMQPVYSNEIQPLPENASQPHLHKKHPPPRPVPPKISKKPVKLPTENTENNMERSENPLKTKNAEDNPLMRKQNTCDVNAPILLKTSSTVVAEKTTYDSSFRSYKSVPVKFGGPQIIDCVSKEELKTAIENKYSSSMTKESKSGHVVSSNISQENHQLLDDEDTSKSGSYSLLHTQDDNISSSYVQGSYRKVLNSEFVDNFSVSPAPEVKLENMSQVKNAVFQDELKGKLRSKYSTTQKTFSVHKQSTYSFNSNYATSEKSSKTGTYSFIQPETDFKSTAQPVERFCKLPDPSLVQTVKKMPPPRPPPPQPKRPPRKKQRSQTAVITRHEITEAREKYQRSRRSQSLTEADLAKRLWMAEKPSRPPIDLKTLYTKVQKDSAKISYEPLKQKTETVSRDFEKVQKETTDNDSVEGNVQCRPLPAPPPPPRTKKRSAESTPASPASGERPPPQFSQERAKVETQKLLDSKFSSATKSESKSEYKAKKQRPLNLFKRIRTSSNPKCKVQRSHSDTKVSDTLDLKKLNQNSRPQSMFYVTESSAVPVREQSPSIGSDLSSAYDSLYPRPIGWYDDGDAADESNVSSHVASMDEEPSPVPNSDVENSSNVRKCVSSVLSSRSSSGRKKDEKVERRKLLMDDKKEAGDTYCYEFQDKSETSDTESIKIRIRIEKKTERGGEEKVVVKRSVPVKEIIRIDGRESRSQPSGANRFSSEVSPSDSLSQIPDIVAEEEADLPTPIVNDANDFPTLLLSNECVPTCGTQPALFKNKIGGISSASDSWHSAMDSSSDSADEEVDNRYHKDQMYLIAKEIMTTERSYMDVLKLINTDFKAHIIECKDTDGHPVISQATLDQILKYLPQLQTLNENFFLDLCNRIKNWDETPRIADIIVKIGPFFKLYASYVSEFESMNYHFDEICRKNSAFAKALKDFQMTERCRMLALKHYMLKPVQRIPQYKLLLEKYLKHVPENTDEYNDTQTALAIVSKVADHINQSIKDVDNFNKMIEIQSTIVGNYELIRPGRLLIKEGPLNKLSRKGAQTRWFVLLNDCLLYMTPTPQGYKINYNLPLTGLKVMIPTQEEYQNEFSILSMIRSFSLSASSIEERQSWITALNDAIFKNTSRRNTFNNVQSYQSGSKSDSEVSSLTLGHQAPVWIPDARVSMCQICTSGFTVTFRRHHCRACGKVVCKRCSANKAALQYRHYRFARVCDECYQVLDLNIRNVGGVSIKKDQMDSESDVTTTESESSSVSSPSVTFEAQPKKTNPIFQRRKGKGKSALEEVTANDQNSDISGYLQRKIKKNWKKWWFVIKDKVLYAYLASEDIKALESTPLLGYEVAVVNEAVEGYEGGIAFQLSHRGRPAMIFYAENELAGRKWMKTMAEATVLQ